MNLQQVIAAIDEKVVEAKANADAREVQDTLRHPEGAFSLPRPPFVWKWVEDALRERMIFFQQELTKEQACAAAQEAELKRALKREGLADESVSD